MSGRTVSVDNQGGADQNRSQMTMILTILSPHVYVARPSLETSFTRLIRKSSPAARRLLAFFRKIVNMPEFAENIFAAAEPSDTVIPGQPIVATTHIAPARRYDDSAYCR